MSRWIILVNDKSAKGVPWEQRKRSRKRDWKEYQMKTQSLSVVLFRGPQKIQVQ